MEPSFEDRYSKADRRRARLALLLFVLALCEGTADRDAPTAGGGFAQAHAPAGP